jgi:hypothetical protein
MSNQEESSTSQAIDLSDDDVAFLFSVLRDHLRPQPVTTQQLIDALRSRSEK